MYLPKLTCKRLFNTKTDFWDTKKHVCYVDRSKLFQPVWSKHLFSNYMFSFFFYFTDTKQTPEKEENVLINMICTELFRDILKHFVSPANLNLEIEKQKSKLEPLSDLHRDVDFFYVLMRDMCNISPHRNGWRNPPDSKDKCAAACIDRIKLKLDEIRSPECSFSTSKFQDVLRKLRNDIAELERQILDGHLYEERVDNLFSIETVNDWAGALRIGKEHTPVSGKLYFLIQFKGIETTALVLLR